MRLVRTSQVEPQQIERRICGKPLEERACRRPEQLAVLVAIGIRDRDVDRADGSD